MTYTHLEKVKQMSGNNPPRPEQSRAEKVQEARDFLTPESAPLTPMTKDSSEINGPRGPEPTRYGDWERKGICYDF